MGFAVEMAPAGVVGSAASSRVCVLAAAKWVCGGAVAAWVSWRPWPHRKNLAPGVTTMGFALAMARCQELRRAFDCLPQRADVA